MGCPEPAGGPSPGERGSPAALNARLRHPCLPSDSGLVLGLCSPGESPGRGGGGRGRWGGAGAAAAPVNPGTVLLGARSHVLPAFVFGAADGVRSNTLN